MNWETLEAIVFKGVAVLAVLGMACMAQAQSVKTPYPTMAPLDQYLIVDRNAEIALARSAAPESISRDAEIMVFGRHGYEIAVKGKNGFVCMVERSWAAGSDDPDFWNPKVRSPNCFNLAAARYNIALMKKKTELALAGRSAIQISKELNAAFDKKELPPLETGAICYMMSKQGYLNDGAGRWHPHLMFFVPLTEPETSGANLPGSPLIGVKDSSNRMTIYMIRVAKRSDGTADSTANSMDDH